MSGRFTKEQEALLRDTWGKGCSVDTIAEVLGISIDEARAMPARLGLPSRKEKSCEARRQALALCAVLEAYWVARGCSSAHFHPRIVAWHNGAPIYGVRSNLVNGLPPEGAA